MTVEAHNESGVDLDLDRLLALAEFVLADRQINPLAELSILFVDRVEMESLHVKWMGEPGPTDVLAFPMNDLRTGPASDTDPTPALLGDVVLCPAVATDQGNERGHGMMTELEILLTHGILHLLGYDHADPIESAEMFGLQDAIIERWRASR